MNLRTRPMTIAGGWAAAACLFGASEAGGKR